jgi:hypothetical protein
MKYMREVPGSNATGLEAILNPRSAAVVVEDSSPLGLLATEDGSNTFPSNVGNPLPVARAQCPRRVEFSPDDIWLFF